MAFDGAVLGEKALTDRMARQIIDANSGAPHAKAGEISVISFLRNFDEEREFVLRKKYLESDLADAQRFGNFKNYILFISEEFDRNLRNEIDQINNVINALEKDDPDQHADVIGHLRDVKNDFKNRRKRQKTFQDDVGNVTDPKDYNDLETAFADLQKEMSSAKLASQDWRDLYKNYWTNPGAYLAYRAKAKDRATPAMMAAGAPPTGKNGKLPQQPKAEEWNEKLEKLLKTKLIALSKVSDPHKVEREFTFLHDMYGEKLVDKGLQNLHNETSNPQYGSMRQEFAKIVTKLHSKKGPNPAGP